MLTRHPSQLFLDALYKAYIKESHFSVMLLAAPNHRIGRTFASWLRPLKMTIKKKQHAKLGPDAMMNLEFTEG